MPELLGLRLQYQKKFITLGRKHMKWSEIRKQYPDKFILIGDMESSKEENNFSQFFLCSSSDINCQQCAQEKYRSVDYEGTTESSQQ